MWDTRPVPLVVHLPPELAEDVEEVRESDPGFLGRAIQYALARRVIFQELRSSMDPVPNSNLEETGGSPVSPPH